MRRALVTIGSGPMEPVLKVALPTFEEFAERHGYELVLGTGTEAPGRPPSWSRIPLISGLLEDHDEVLWVDADAIFVDTTDDVSHDVPPEAYQALVMHVDPTPPGYPIANCGVWFLRSTERTDRFLSAVWDKDEYIHHPWWENTAVLDLLGYEIKPKPTIEHHSEWMDGIHWLDQSWNWIIGSPPIEHVRIKHYAAMANWARRYEMRRDRRGKGPARFTLPRKLLTAYWLARGEPRHRAAARLRE